MTPGLFLTCSSLWHGICKYYSCNQKRNDMKKFWVVGIEYDTDGEIVDLPENLEVECEDIEQAIDRVSDETGWLVKSVKNIIEL